MEPDTQALADRLSALETKIDAVYASSEKIRKYFLWTGIVTLVVIVLPLIVLPLILPAFLSSLTIPAGF